MILFTPEQKTELLELLYARLDTIIDDPSSADEFETERSLTILENKIKNDQEFTQQEIDWMVGEAENRDDIIVMTKIAKILAKHTEQPIITAVQKSDNDSVALVRKITIKIPESKFTNLIYNQPFKYNDGGRKAAGYVGVTGDCVCRAVCIASGLPYQQVYNALSEGNATQRKTKKGSKRTGQYTAAHGINVKRKWFQEYMESIGFEWTPTMKIGQGCKVHLRADELPKGRLVISVSKHYTTMIDGVINDTYDPSRDGTRCVYGYFTKK